MAAVGNAYVYGPNTHRSARIFRSEGDPVDPARALPGALGPHHDRTACQYRIRACITVTQAVHGFVLCYGGYRYLHIVIVGVGNARDRNRDELVVGRPEKAEAWPSQFASGRLIAVAHVDRHRIRL